MLYVQVSVHDLVRVKPPMQFFTLVTGPFASLRSNKQTCIEFVSRAKNGTENDSQLCEYVAT